jgi:hypothetical protein
MKDRQAQEEAKEQEFKRTRRIFFIFKQRSK